MNVVRRGILSGNIVGSTSYGDFKFFISDFEFLVNTTGGLKVGTYLPMYFKVSEGSYKRVPYQIKLTKANIRLCDGIVWITANYVLCQE